MIWDMNLINLIALLVICIIIDNISLYERSYYIAHIKTHLPFFGQSGTVLEKGDLVNCYLR